MTPTLPALPTIDPAKLRAAMADLEAAGRRAKHRLTAMGALDHMHAGRPDLAARHLRELPDDALAALATAATALARTARTIRTNRQRKGDDK